MKFINEINTTKLITIIEPAAGGARPAIRTRAKKTVMSEKLQVMGDEKPETGGHENNQHSF